MQLTWCGEIIALLCAMQHLNSNCSFNSAFTDHKTGCLKRFTSYKIRAFPLSVLLACSRLAMAAAIGRPCKAGHLSADVRNDAARHASVTSASAPTVTRHA